MEPALKTMIDNMPEKTGKTLEEWKALLATQAFERHGEAVKHLKQEYGVTHGFANTIVTLYRQDQTETVDLVDAQYKGKEALLPMYDRLIAIAKEMGDDVTITPKKTSVSLIRKHQFALIKPATKTRIDLGLKLPDAPVKGKLEDSGPFGTMCTHRIQLENSQDIDNEVIEYMQAAYNRSK